MRARDVSSRMAQQATGTTMARVFGDNHSKMFQNRRLKTIPDVLAVSDAVAV